MIQSQDSVWIYNSLYAPSQKTWAPRIQDRKGWVDTIIIVRDTVFLINDVRIKSGRADRERSVIYKCKKECKKELGDRIITKEEMKECIKMKMAQLGMN